MSEYTEGPWEAKKKSRHSVTWRIVSSIGHVLGLSSTEANAHLISAAPDMYEALKKAIQALNIAIDWNLDEIEIDGEMIATSELRNELFSVKAKAEGREE